MQFWRVDCFAQVYGEMLDRYKAERLEWLAKQQATWWEQHPLLDKPNPGNKSAHGRPKLLLSSTDYQLRVKLMSKRRTLLSRRRALVSSSQLEAITDKLLELDHKADKLTAQIVQLGGMPSRWLK